MATDINNGQTVELNVQNGKAISRNISSNILYSDIAADFNSGEPEFNSNGNRVVWSDEISGITYKLAVIETAKRYEISSSELAGGLVYIPFGLADECSFQTMIALNVAAAKAYLITKHQDMYNATVEGDGDKVAGSSDGNGTVSFTYLDAIYLLMNKRQGRTASDGVKTYNLDMDKATFDKLLAHPDFKDIVKVHVAAKREPKANTAVR